MSIVFNEFYIACNDVRVDKYPKIKMPNTIKLLIKPNHIYSQLYTQHKYNAVWLRIVASILALVR